MSFISELKRRNVFRVSLAYLALSWAAIEVTSAVVPALHLPDAMRPIVVWLALIGFPFIVAFSWAYEMTPEGLKRERDVDRTLSITHITGRRLDNITIVLLLVAIALFALQYFRPAQDETAQQLSTTDVGEATQPSDSVFAQSPADNDKSIAVLPFSDMSEARDQEYMSDGIAEELLNMLAKVPDLRVIARTSSFAFKNRDVSIEQIAKELRVAHVVEGSVRKAGDRLRITAQLIRTSDSTHLWSETYDRPLDDIFAVQDEIAGAIVQALRIKLMGGILARRQGGTQSLDAYQLYLRSGTLLYQNTRSSLVAANDYLEQAIDFDPNFGLALTRLAHVAIGQADNAFVSPTEGYERARRLAETALQTSPDLVEAHAVLQYVYQTLDWNWETAAAEGRRALAIDSTDPLLLNVAGKLASTLGQWDVAERSYRASLLRDPLYTYALYNLGSMYYLAGRLEESESVLRQLLDLEPDFGWTWYALGKTLLAQGKAEAALETVRLDVDEGNQLWLLPIVLQATGYKTEADLALQSQIAVWAENGPYCIALSYAYRGERDLAFEWLERSYELRDPTLVEIVGEPLFDNLVDDPRFAAFLRRMNLPEL